MSHPELQLEDADRLLSALIDGDLDAARREQVLEAMRASADLRRRYLEFIHLHSLLKGAHPLELPVGASQFNGRSESEAEETFVAGDPSSVVRGPLSVAKAVSGQRSADSQKRLEAWDLRLEEEQSEIRNQKFLPSPLTPHRSSLLRRPLSFSLCVSTVATVAVLLTASQIHLGDGGKRTQLGLGVSPVVARVVAGRDCRWGERSEAVFEGAYLRAGQTVDLREGFAEIRFNRGAVAVVEGPALLVLESENRGRLDQGRLVARIENKMAAGFAIVTPTATVVDLGTEFGATVAPDGQTDITVFQGRVEVRPHDDLAATRRLSAGESISLRRQPNGSLAFNDPPAGNYVRSLRSDEPPPSNLRVAIFQQGAPTPGRDDVPYAGAEDTQLTMWDAKTNYGGRADFDVGALTYRDNFPRPGHALLRFDVFALVGKIERIHAARLRLHVNESAFYYPWASNGKLLVYRVSDANADWQEGDFLSAAEGNPAPGDSTWLVRRAPDVPWAGHFGASVRGVDYHEKALAAQAYASWTDGTLDFAFHGDLSFLDRWAANPKTNAGFLLRTEDESRMNRINFHSSEAENVKLRPELMIEYVPRE